MRRSWWRAAACFPLCRLLPLVGREAAERAAVEEEGCALALAASFAASLGRAERLDTAYDDEVVAAGMHGVHHAVDPGRGAREPGRPGGRAP